MKAIILVAILRGVAGIMGFDCGSQHFNVTTLSLLDVGSCDIPNIEPVATRMFIQLLQLNHFTHAHVIQCKIEVDRTVYYCGMHSHVSIVSGGRLQYIREITEKECRTAHEKGHYPIFNYEYIQNLKKNQSVTHSITLGGSLDNEGSCQGIFYADPYGTWSKVVVQAVVKITLQEFYAPVDLLENKIKLQSGISVPLSDESCIDVTGGYAFWKSIPKDMCNFNQYEIVAEGMGTRMEDEAHQTVYTIEQDDVVFALTKREEIFLCHRAIITTEHPKLFIMEHADLFPHNPFKKQKSINMDIFTYVNSKFVYVEKHVKKQLKRLYHDMLIQRCELEREVIRNALSIATIAPDEFAYRYMKKPGYMALVAGEVIHIIKCVPVPIKRKITSECYSQLPVYKGNETLYLTPKTHVLLKMGTQVDCNPILPTMFKINETWYQMIPTAVKTPEPQIMQPSSKPTWTYVDAKNLGISGIYSEKDLDKLRDRIMFPAERNAVLNTVARGMTGQAVVKQGLSVAHLFDEETLEKLADSTWNKIWGMFLNFGTASAGIIGLFALIRLIKLIIDTFIHGYALHTVYGWSLHLLGAIWDSVTHLLLHLAKKSEQIPKAAGNSETELIEKASKNEDGQENPTAPNSGGSYFSYTV